MDCLLVDIARRISVLVVRVPGYRFRRLGFDSGRYHSFWGAVGLERGPLSFVRMTGELYDEKVAASGMYNRNYRPWGPAALTTH
jgi:hypothetical protein